MLRHPHPAHEGSPLASLVTLEGVEVSRFDDEGQGELAGLGVLPLPVEADAAARLDVAQQRGGVVADVLALGVRRDGEVDGRIVGRTW